jgi:hypothetical protein
MKSQLLCARNNVNKLFQYNPNSGNYSFAPGQTFIYCFKGKRHVPLDMVTRHLHITITNIETAKIEVFKRFICMMIVYIVFTRN